MTFGAKNKDELNNRRKITEDRIGGINEFEEFTYPEHREGRIKQKQIRVSETWAIIKKDIIFLIVDSQMGRRKNMELKFFSRNSGLKFSNLV